MQISLRKRKLVRFVRMYCGLTKTIPWEWVAQDNTVPFENTWPSRSIPRPGVFDARKPTLGKYTYISQRLHTSRRIPFN